MVDVLIIMRILVKETATKPSLKTFLMTLHQKDFNQLQTSVDGIAKQDPL